MMNRFLSSLICAAVLTTGAGCRHAGGEADLAVVPPTENQMAPPADPGLNRVIILAGESPDGTDGATGAPRLTIERQRSVRLAPGALEVYATLRNRTDAPLAVELRVQFFGAQQEPVEGPTEWQPLSLRPAGLVTFKGQSLALRNVEYFTIEVREALQ